MRIVQNIWLKTDIHVDLREVLKNDLNLHATITFFLPNNT